MVSRPWKTTEIAKLRKWYDVLSVREISERLGKSYSAIYSKASRLGLKRPEVQYRDVTEIKRLIRRGWSETQIAEHLGITKQSLWERLSTPGYTDAELERAAKNWRMMKENDSQ
jgi:IS30 family transposase